MGTRKIFGVVVVVMSLVAAAAWAIWSVNGNPVSTATGSQDFIAMTADGLGGAAMVWQDNRGASQDIYAQEIDAFGANVWSPGNGVALCTATGLQQSPRVVHNGFGYLHFAWQDYRSGNPDIYIASTDRLGNIFTPADGLALCTATGDQTSPSMAVYGPTGTVFAAWQDNRAGNGDIYLAAFSQYNGITTPANGAPVCTLPSAQEAPAVAVRMLGHGVVAWSDFRSGTNYDIYAQSVGFTGPTQWTANGVPVCTAAAAQLDAMIIDDGNYGVIIAWRDYRNGTFTQAIYAQKLDSGGVPQWAANGVLVAQSTDFIQQPRMISDGAGGAIIAWEDDRNIATTGPDIYVQRIDSGGNHLWGANGTVVCNANFAQYATEMVTDGAGGAVITWFDYRSLGPTDVYAQRVNPTGTLLWTANGIPVCNAVGNQSNPKIAKVDASGVILAWEDRRTQATTNTDVFAQRVDLGGLFGYPQPYITSIEDVPGDQGGFVRITLRQGDGQAPGEEFEVYNLDYHGGDVVYVGTFNGSATYTFDVLTTAVGVPNSYYVSAGYQSNTAQGTSIDNLAPPAPALSGQRVGANVNLSWNATAPDIDHYVLQRTGASDVVVGTTSYTDVGVPQTALYYRVYAVDVNGNAGALSNQVTIDAATPVGDTPGLPTSLALLQNSPNPFSGSTRLRIGLPAEADVRLDVFDVAGRRVLAREIGRLNAGWRDLAFDGRDERGQPLASGVYFYRVTAGRETMTHKMVIGR